MSKFLFSQLSSDFLERSDNIFRVKPFSAVSTHLCVNHHRYGIAATTKQFLHAFLRKRFATNRTSLERDHFLILTFPPIHLNGSGR
uniref:Uncharacterized protein n=1 Tax=Candidatus Kentrum sp. DK TaxID=2126562 RepID=A0A450RTB2_9GAMM|nr:MAG: hypothetical protein BECKDK2373B_GA0170837_10011 [Candidatus Kentron sp. DK]